MFNQSTQLQNPREDWSTALGNKKLRPGNETTELLDSNLLACQQLTSKDTAVTCSDSKLKVKKSNLINLTHQNLRFGVTSMSHLPMPLQPHAFGQSHQGHQGSIQVSLFIFIKIRPVTNRVYVMPYCHLDVQDWGWV
ncbi:hypothetical protein OCU04_006793 [Sclerotinia nivalis]|uniref:Uncharacterized protein n=1 Tax=Sclerotinia nivalis TaxID=352851 RepID=A0A9X0DJ97_9HELO|nr:hypothetical protein OCU04_006793 [Sclerotinia nivalis]